MEYAKLKAYVINKLMSTTMEWNAKTGVYPVKPAGLSESQEAIWLMITGSTRIGELSEIQTKALRDMASEALGAKLPDKQVKTFKNPPAYVCLSVTKDGARYLNGTREERLIMKKLSGPWAPEGSNRLLEQDEINSNWTRLPSVEDIDRLVSAIPEDKLAIVMSGLLPLKKTQEVSTLIEEKLKSVSVEYIRTSRPTLEGISAKEAALYRMAIHDVGAEYIKATMIGCDLEWSDDKRGQVQSYDNSKFSPPVLTCVQVNSKSEVLINSSSSITKKGISTFDTLTWEQVSPVDDKEYEKLAKMIPMEYCLAYLPAEIVSKLIEEVELE